MRVERKKRKKENSKGMYQIGGGKKKEKKRYLLDVAENIKKCVRRESNPGLNLGRVASYRCTTNAFYLVIVEALNLPFKADHCRLFSSIKQSLLYFCKMALLCPRCENPVLPGARFCPRDGQAIPASPALNTNARVCEKCSQTISQGKSRCVLHVVGFLFFF